MTVGRRGAFTRVAFRLHGWVGLAGALLLLNVGVTGAVLVFAPELDRALRPELYFVPRGAAARPVAELYEAVRAAHPTAHAVSIRRLPSGPDRSLELGVAYRDQRGAHQFRSVFLDPYTGRTLGHKEWNAGFVENPTVWLVRLHFTLLAGRAGQVATALLSLLFLASLATGLVVYRRFIVRALLLQVPLRLRSWRTGASELHRVVGVWAWLFNLVIALTGLWFMRGVFTPAFYREQVSLPPAPRLAVSLDRLLATAVARVPTFVPRGLSVRADGDGVATAIELYGDDRERSSLLPAWASRLRFDARTGALERVDLVSRAPAATKLELATGPLHFGTWGGLPVRLLYATGALAPPLLALTGVFLWFRRGRPRPRAPDLGTRSGA
jgi:uncharacterized iron-regulated membrane protein